MADNEAAKDPLGNIPRYAIFRGYRVRIIGYEDGRFTVIDKDDGQRWVYRSQLRLIKERKVSKT